MKLFFTHTCTLITVLGLNTLTSADFSIKPVVYGAFNTAGGVWNTDSSGAAIGGFGLITEATRGNWYYYGRWVYASLHGTSSDPFKFSTEQGIPFSQGYSMLEGDFWYDYADMLIRYSGDNYKFEFGKFDRVWGPGLSSVTVSNKSPSFPQFGFDWDIRPNLSVSYFHGFLNSDIPDSSRADYYTGVGAREFNISRSVAGHRLEWRPFDFLVLGATDLVIYAVRPLEVIYLMPFIPFWALQHYSGDTDNLQMAGDITWLLEKNRKIYLVWFLDEWSIENTFDKEKDHNWFGWQFGLAWPHLVRENDHFQVEYSWTDHRVYRHRFEVNDSYSHGYPLGFWAGPHAQELYAEYSAEFFGFDWVLAYSDVKRGELTDDMLSGQYGNIKYDRFSNISEQRTVLDIQASKSVWKQEMMFYLGISLIDWKNAGFDPFNPNAGSVKDVNKVSITLGFSYNFRPPGLAGRYTIK